MCSEIDRFSSFLRRNMSGTRNTLLPHVKEQDEAKSLDGEEEKGEVAFLTEGKENSNDQKEVEKVATEDEGSADRKNRVSVSVSISEENESTDGDGDGDGDGFVTPTSADHKIPAIIHCPPAPKKPRPEPSRMKRKTSPPLPCELDSTAEIESIFRPISSQDTGEEQKSKKARREGDD
ncbi:cyclin-dependent protein kinase inhibitor SMR3-like [Andrographis paniculata]|uniref:cyclin-dependent protein kinase inhibitor SMR3-like n=1 Tax=Andrographis paniculata TaxID=175694 RepID=UPI0021E795FB|nr:cyclin-dependent protein kinase inhibitor SMR3-like [Andrographis paniculata]